MKNKLIKNLLGIASIFLLVVFVGCKDDDMLLEVSVVQATPNPVYPYETVSVEGLNFDTVQFVFVADRQVDFNLDGGTLNFVVPDDTLVPSGTTTVTLAMANNYRVTFDLEILVLPIPVIKTISPTAAPAGSQVLITGTSLDNDTVVTIEGVPATISSNNGSEMVIIVPDGLPNNTLSSIEIETSFGETESSTLFYVGENLIVNGEFEEGSGDDFTDWEKLNGGANMTEVTGGSAYSGRSMHVVGAEGNPWDTQLASQPIALSPGSEYTIVIWAKAEAEGAIMRTSVSQYPEDYFYGDDIEIATEWTQYSWTFAGEELPNGSKIVFDMGTTSVPFVMDNMTLVQAGGSTQAPDLLVNGDFEDDLASTWEITNGTLETTSAESYCGSNSLTATGTASNPWDVQIVSDPAASPTLDVGTLYELGFWAKAAGPDGIMRASVSRWDGNGDDFFYTPDFTVAEDWTYYGFVFEAQATNSGVHQVVLDFGATSQTFYVDAVSLREYNAPASLHSNGDFETGDLTDWEVTNGAFEVTTAEAYEGSNSLTATGTASNPWDVQVVTTPDASPTLEVGTKYLLSFWAKAAGPDGIMRASVSRWDGNGDDFFYTPDVTVTEDWEFYSFVFEAASTNSGVHQVVLDFGATSQTFFVDNVNVSEYADPCN